MDRHVGLLARRWGLVLVGAMSTLLPSARESPERTDPAWPPPGCRPEVVARAPAIAPAPSEVGVPFTLHLDHGSGPGPTHLVILTCAPNVDPDGTAAHRPRCQLHEASGHSAWTQASLDTAQAFVLAAGGRAPTASVPLGNLDGASGGATFALALWGDTHGEVTGDLVVAASARITPWGLLERVDGIRPKLAAADLVAVDLVVVAPGNAADLAGYERPVVVLPVGTAAARIDAARRAGEAWDRCPAVLVAAELPEIGAFLCGATGAVGACALARAAVPAPGPAPGTTSPRARGVDAWIDPLPADAAADARVDPLRVLLDDMVVAGRTP